MYEKLLAVLRHCGNENVPCEGCPVHDECGYFDVGAARNMRESADAIEELSKRVPPVPHGDLIDRDALIKDGWLNLHKEVIRMGGYAIHELPLKNPSIPVIVPAEEEPAEDINVPTTYDLLYEEWGAGTT